MNLLLLGLLYHPSVQETVARNSRDGLQNQINNYQWAIIQGIQQNLQPGERLSVLNSLPVGVFPTHYRKLILPFCQYSDEFREIGCINLPWVKQSMRAAFARKEIERWVKASPNNRTILLYTLYLPYMQAIAAVKRRHPDVKATVIITDLPNELGIASGRKGLLKKLEYRRGNQSLSLSKQFDGFVLLTKPMASALDIVTRPQLILEGLISEAPAVSEITFATPADRRPAVLYTGTLNRELGIGELLSAFQHLTEAQLWLCGRGDMENEIKAAAKACDHIHYFGFLPQQQALALQAKADALINPRTAQGLFTRYSFPSKTLEYMRSGKPVLCCKLEGIPDEYDDYLLYIEPQNAEGIVSAIRALLHASIETRDAMGERARAFVMEQKNSKAQCAKLVGFLRALQNP